MHFRVVIIFLFHSFSSVFAQNQNLGVLEFSSGTQEQCKTRNVDTSNMPDNRDQWSLGWCHSYALADLLSFYVEQKISPYPLAASIAKANLDQKKRIKNVGEFSSNPLLVYEEILDQSTPLCPEKNFKKNEMDWKSISSEINKFSVMNRAERMCSKGYHNLVSDLNIQDLNLFEKLSNQNFVLALIELKCAREIELPKGTLSDYERSGFKAICKNLKMEKKGCWHWKTTDTSQFFDQINRKLDSDEPSIAYIDLDLFRKRPDGVNKNYNHFSVVIGRRWNETKKTCEYQIRNSWGADCSQYPKLYTDDCVDGNLWIPQMNLQRSLGGVITFDSENEKKSYFENNKIPTN